MRNKFSGSRVVLESRAMLSASPVRLEDIDVSSIESLDDLPNEIIVPSSTSAVLNGLSSEFQENGVALTTFDADGNEVPIDTSFAGFGGQTSIALEENDNAAFVAQVSPFSEVSDGDSGAEDFVATPPVLPELFGTFSSGNSEGFSGDFVQSGDTTYLSLLTQESVDRLPDTPAFGDDFGDPDDEFTQFFFAADDAFTQEQQLELENSRQSGSQGGARVTTEESQLTADDAAAAAANQLFLGLYRGVTGNQEDGSTLLQRVDFAERSNLTSRQSEGTTGEQAEDSDQRRERRDSSGRRDERRERRDRREKA